MGLVTINLHFGTEIKDLTIDSYFIITLFAKLIEQFAVMSFASSDYGCQDDDLFVCELLENTLMNLVFGILDHLITGDIRISFACTCIQKTEEIVDLGDRSYSRSG